MSVPAPNNNKGQSLDPTPVLPGTLRAAYEASGNVSVVDDAIEAIDAWAETGNKPIPSPRKADAEAERFMLESHMSGKSDEGDEAASKHWRNHIALIEEKAPQDRTAAENMDLRVELMKQTDATDLEDDGYYNEALDDEWQNIDFDVRFMGYEIDTTPAPTSQASGWNLRQMATSALTSVGNTLTKAVNPNETVADFRRRLIRDRQRQLARDFARKEELKPLMGKKT